MSQEKSIGMDVHQATISVAVTDSRGKLIMEVFWRRKRPRFLPRSLPKFVVLALRRHLRPWRSEVKAFSVAKTKSALVKHRQKLPTQRSEQWISKGLGRR